MVTSEFPPVVGGIASHVYELSKELVKQGNKVTVVSRLKKGDKKKENLEGMSVYRYLLFGNRVLYECSLALKLKQLTKKEPFDLVHVHGMRPLNSVKKLGLPVFFTNHSSGFLKRLNSVKNKKRALKRISHCDLVFAPSMELIEATKKTGYLGKTAYIPNGVDEDFFKPGGSSIRKTYNIPEDAFVVLLARRLAKKNGVLYFAEAINKVKNKKCIFIIAGDGEEKKEFESIVKEKISSGKVKMLGKVPNKEMPELFRATNLSVLPSLMEATSIAGLEAMSSGVPLLGTNVGGIPEIIQDNKNGIIIEAKSSEEIAHKIEWFSKNPKITTLFGNNARESVLKNFTWAIIAGKTKEIYKQC